MQNYAKLCNNIQKHAKYYPILLLLLSFDHTQHTQNYIKVYQFTEIYISVQNWTILYKNKQNFSKSYIAIWSHSTYTIQNYTKVYKFTKIYISVQNYTILYKSKAILYNSFNAAALSARPTFPLLVTLTLIGLSHKVQELFWNKSFSQT